VEELQQAGLLGPRAPSADRPSIDYFTTTYRQHLVFEEMKKMVRGYLQLWYR
jgi:hypothetical protein